MLCKCGQLQDAISCGESEEAFVKRFQLVAERPYLRLYRCRHCGTHWQLDFGDRSDLAIKVADPEHWETFDDRPFRRGFFIGFHGGEAAEQCCWAGCKRKVLKDKAICVDHAYPEYAPN